MKMCKRFMAIFLAIVCCFATSITVFAANTDEIKEIQEVSTSTGSVQPYSDNLLATVSVPITPSMGTSWHFGLQTNKATGLIKRYKAVITTSDFKSDTYVAVQINNSNGVSLMTQAFAVNGNQSATIPLSSSNYINGDTLDIWWNVMSADDVTVGDSGRISIKIYSY